MCVCGSFVPGEYLVHFSNHPLESDIPGRLFFENVFVTLGPQYVDVLIQKVTGSGNPAIREFEERHSFNILNTRPHGAASPRDIEVGPRILSSRTPHMEASPENRSLTLAHVLQRCPLETS